MLRQCLAHLVARDARHSAELETLATRAGFVEIQSILSRRAVEAMHSRLKLNYFLVHHRLTRDLMKAVLLSVRASAIAEIRFAPVVLFASDGPFEEYLEYIELGFDDVITLPENREMIVQRLRSQLGTEHTYFETANYLGPDRRRMEIAPPSEHKRAANPHSHSRYVFRREPDRGIEIIRQEVFVALGQQPRQQTLGHTVAVGY